MIPGKKVYIYVIKLQKGYVSMAKNLVIVESPAKAKTIKKFLGSNYEVIASNGHVRDLPKSQMGIDVDNDFEPKYITIRGKGDILAALRKAVKKADKIYLATDPDREGEAISYHLMKALKLGAIETHVADARTCCLNPATSTHRQMNDEQLKAAGIPAGLIRISCGLEDKKDLIADIAQALEAI